MENVEGREHRDDVAIMDTASSSVYHYPGDSPRSEPDLQAEEQLPSTRPLLKQICRSIQPQPAHRRTEPISRPSAIVMDHIPRVLKIPPVFMCENIAPGTTTASKNLKAAHLLHAVDFSTCKRDIRVLKLEACTDLRQVRG